MLPPTGTHARTQLEDDAIQIGLDALQRENGNIPNALYLTYQAFRMRFIQERGLMYAVPGVGDIWREALQDARTLERYVTTRWAAAIAATLHASGNEASSQ
jgi:hypothetical protein